MAWSTVSKSSKRLKSLEHTMQQFHKYKVSLIQYLSVVSKLGTFTSLAISLLFRTFAELRIVGGTGGTSPESNG